MTLVKICGISSPEHAVFAASAGAALIGVVFAPSRRRISLAVARQIAAAVDGAAQIVGLFVDATAQEIRETAAYVGLDAVQLSGTEPVTLLDALGGLTLYKTVRLQGAPDEAAWLSSDARRVTLLADAHVAGIFGGTGALGDWDAAARLAARRSMMLAGGLTSENVAAAIARVRPWGVDVSSGVETAGSKDPAKIAAFIAAAQAAIDDRP